MTKTKIIILITVGVIVLGGLAVVLKRERDKTEQQKQVLTQQIDNLEEQLGVAEANYEELKNTDQVLINQNLSQEIASIKKGYQKAVDIYEKLLDLRDKSNNTKKLELAWAKILTTLGKPDYSQAVVEMGQLEQEIKKLEASATAIKKAPAATTKINTEVGDFAVQVISADLNNTKVVVETGAESSCGNDCPVWPLAEYAKRSGAFAGINSTYFCPATYPSCANKKNSFDTLLMNKNKIYFNADNNVYSSNPVAVFSRTSRFMEKGSEWGRDTSVDAVIMGRPLLVFNGEVKFGGNDDTKESAKGNRSFIGATENTVYIGIVYGATVAEAAKVIAKMGIKNAINLDSGGSTALWKDGRYLAGPGRDLPYGILLVRR